MHTLLCQFSRAAFTLVSAVADEGREAQVSEDWRLWWCPAIKEEWVNEKNLKLSQEAKEVTLTLTLTRTLTLTLTLSLTLALTLTLTLTLTR